MNEIHTLYKLKEITCGLLPAVYYLRFITCSLLLQLSLLSCLQRRVQRPIANQIQEERRCGRNTKRQQNVKHHANQHTGRHLRGEKDPDTANKGDRGKHAEDDEEDIEVSAEDIVRNHVGPRMFGLFFRVGHVLFLVRYFLSVY